MVAVTAANPVGSLNEAAVRLQKKVRPVYTKTTGAETLTAAQLIDGLVNQNAAQAAFNLTTPTAAAIVAALKDAAVGDTFSFTVVNHAGGAAITVVGGTGVTVKGAAAVAIAGSGDFLARLDTVTGGAEAVSLYRVS